MTTLVAFSGRPGVGKTTVAQALCRITAAVCLRGAGYAILAELAAENLRLGNIVVADTVNPVAATRQMWRDVAQKTGARLLTVEVICSDLGVHRRRVERRVPDRPGQTVPSWDDVQNRDYEAWAEEVVRVDTATTPASDCAQAIARLL